MATAIGSLDLGEKRPDLLSGTPRAHAIDRWIFVFMAAWFIAIVLAGFIPDSLMKIEMVRTGQRPPCRSQAWSINEHSRTVSGPPAWASILVRRS